MACYEDTKDHEVPRYDAGHTSTRNAWDDTVAEALGINRDKLSRWADMLNEEPVVSVEQFRERLLRSESDRRHYRTETES